MVTKCPLMVSASAAASLAILSACQLPTIQVAPVAVVENNPAAWANECADVAGYGDFRRALINAVSAQDPTALRSLFASDGRMRMNGVGGDRQSADWGLDRASASDVWSELEQILHMGCASRKDRLYLPAMAVASADEGGGDTVIAIRNTAIWSSSDRTSRVLERVPMGRSLTYDMPVDADWNRIVTAQGAQGFVPAEDFRSPTSTVIELVREGHTWRIQWLGGNL